MWTREREQRPIESELTAGNKQHIARCSLQKSDSEIAFSLVLPLILRLVRFLSVANPKETRSCEHILPREVTYLCFNCIRK